MIILQVGVKAALRNGAGKYLLLKRSPAKYPEVKEPWDVPGGRIEPGLPLFENLKREIREETGLDPEEEFRLVAAQDVLRVPGRHVVRLTYLGRADGDCRLDADHSECGWFSREELGNLPGLDSYFRELLDKELL